MKPVAKFSADSANAFSFWYFGNSIFLECHMDYCFFVFIEVDFEKYKMLEIFKLLQK